ncbi:MAG: sigma-54 dependent transcriptional regulator, partial [Candidatus Roizmanbacteria bacterium]|nr:sigma-54 dependent transcriptional regulator [Candidatus Roizmanbacteria bacterium]
LLLDIRLPEQSGIDILQELKEKGINTQVVMLTADDTIETAVKAMKLGAADYITKPFNTDELKIVVSNIIEKEKLKQEVSYLRKTCSEFIEKNIVGESKAIKELILKVEKMAQLKVSTILITGESGTGKEIVARHIHHLMYGDAATGYAPFIPVNCSAMPETLLESELFGYQKGAFTDAKSDKKGLFEIADGGTILLDEIGDMNPSLQSKLLRVLEERTVRRIGGKEGIPIDVTIIATTNKNLLEAMEKGEFRMDVFFRLTTFYLHILPLRERREDIPLLARHFLSYFATKYNKKTIKGFSPESEKFMISYDWPGNIRELKNLVERIVVLENTEVILPEHLPKWLTDHLTVKQPSGNNRFILPESGISLEEVEKDLLMQALEKAGHNKSRAAKLLNISYDTLRYQLKKFGIT